MQAERAAALRRDRWAEREGARIAGKDEAARRAVQTCLLLIPILGVCALAAWVRFGAGQPARGLVLGVLLGMAALAWVAETAAEVRVAKQQGADYLPQGPWPFLAKMTGGLGRTMRGAGRGAAAVARPVREAGGCVGGCLTLIVLVVFLMVLSLTIQLTILLLATGLVALPVAHICLAIRRLRRWQRWHTQQELQAQEGALGQ